MQPQQQRTWEEELYRQEMRIASRDSLRRHQLQRLNGLLEYTFGHNSFYQRKWGGRVRPLDSLDQLSTIPFLEKRELIPEHPGDAARFHSRAIDHYVRYHRTSGTRGRPLPVLDTYDDWQWWIETWQYVLDAADVKANDRAFMAFSFGPFIGFWSANDALVRRGCLVIPGGGMSSEARLETIVQSGASVLCCTPSYALHLALVAQRTGVDLTRLPVRAIIVAGEPGGSVPEIRHKIEAAWQARVVDHAGATELGPWGFGNAAGTGLHVIESEFIAEVIDGEGNPVPDGEIGELVLTGLGRFGCPAIRYRTGDLVRATESRDINCGFVELIGGVLGRADDMLVIRGVNIFPASIDAILCQFPEVEEYRIIAWRDAAMDQLRVEVEDGADDPDRIAGELMNRLGLRIEVRQVPSGTFAAYQGGKARRLIDQRNE